jgi:hypothetical protein
MSRKSGNFGKSISEGSRRFSKLLKASVGIPRGSDDGPEEDHWVVGGRYQVLRQATLHTRPDVKSDRLGEIRPKETVVLLALQTCPHTTGEEMLVAYVANTKANTWVAGWSQIEGPASNSSTAPPPVLRRRRLQGSWEVGGRYIVVGQPVLRERIELESEQICDIRVNEEVLVLDLGLVIRSGEPRLRAKVRADSGNFGWLTVELPGGRPLLEPLNLYSVEALRRVSLFGGDRSSANGFSRVTLSGSSEAAEKAWEIDCKYRCLAPVSVSEDFDRNSKLIGDLRKGSLVLVTDVRGQADRSDVQSLRLKVEIATNDERIVGWLSPINGSEKLLDTRDHLEFEKIMRMQFDTPQLEEQTPAPEPLEFGVCAGSQVEEPLLFSSQHPPPPTDTRRNSKPNAASQKLLKGLRSGEVQKLMTDFEARRSVTQCADAQLQSEMLAEVPPANPQKKLDVLARPFQHLREEDPQDDRQVGDNIESDNCGGICACRDMPLFCGSRAVRGKVSRGGAPPHPPHPVQNGSSGLNLAEPAPEPRPMQQLPSPTLQAASMA